MVKRIERKIFKNYIVYFPILISMGRFVPFADTVITFTAIVILLCELYLRRSMFLKMFVVLILFFISSYIGGEISEHFEYFKPLMIYFLVMNSLDYDVYERAEFIIKKNRKKVKKQLLLIALLCSVVAFLPMGYSVFYSESWGMKAYQGIYGDPHQCAYHIAVLMVYLLVVSELNQSIFTSFLFLLYTVLALLTGARVPSVLVVVLFCVYIYKMFFLSNKKQSSVNKVFKFCFLVLAGFVGLYSIMMFTPFGQKMFDSIANNMLDNGRSNLRNWDILSFNSSNCFEKLFGQGTKAVLDYHGSLPYSPRIWSHNDMLQILLSMGLFMFIFYMIPWFKLLLKAVKKSWVYTIVVLTLIMVAFLNGLFIHHRLVFVLPLLFKYMDFNFIRKRKIEN